MIIKKYSAALIALLLIFALLPALTSAQNEYSDVIEDDEGDVFHFYGAGWYYDVERPNVDILRAELSESEGIVTISLTVKGEITSDEDIYYYISLTDEDDGSYMFTYIEDYGYMIVNNDRGYRNFEPEISGVGTDTLLVTCSLEDLLTPDKLRFVSITSYEYTADGYYYDSASPDEDENDDEDDFIPWYFELEVSPAMGPAPLEVEITFEAENLGDEGGEIPLIVDGDIEEYLWLDPYESRSETIWYTFEEPGDYLIVFGEEMFTVTVSDEPATPYSDVVTDPSENVIRLVGPTEDDWILVDSPDVDILRAEISEEEGIVTVSLTLKGTIRDDPSVYYEIFMTDDADGEFEIFYNDGHCQIEAYRWYNSGGFGNVFEPAINGVGTDTLEIVFTRAQIGNPDVLLISAVEVLDEAAMEVDLAGPHADYPEGYGEPRFLPVNFDMIVDYEPDTFPMDVVIAFIAENDGDLPGEINLYINGDVHYTLELDSRGQAEGEYRTTFDDPGDYLVEFMEMSHTVFVSEHENGIAPPNDEPVDDEPVDDEPVNGEPVNGDREDDEEEDDEESGLLGGLMTWIAVAIVALIISVVFIVLFLGKKKRDQEEEENYPEEQHSQNESQQYYQDETPQHPPDEQFSDFQTEESNMNEGSGDEIPPPPPEEN